jgi:hypothetical protein
MRERLCGLVHRAIVLYALFASGIDLVHIAADLSDAGVLLYRGAHGLFVYALDGRHGLHDRRHLHLRASSAAGKGPAGQVDGAR